MASRRKRKIEDDNRTFQVELEKLYFFTQVKDKAVCLMVVTHLTSLSRTI